MMFNYNDLKHKIYYLCSAGLLLLDQISKQIVASNFVLGESVGITSFFSWTYVQNSGAAFSFLADSGELQRNILLTISIVASLGLVVWIYKTPTSFRQRLFGQSIFLAGAAGNLMDRALFGHVIDFIDLHYASFYWPVFNLADSFIFLGVALLLFEPRQSNAK
jgi:signal peptidase II